MLLSVLLFLGKGVPKSAMNWPAFVTIVLFGIIPFLLLVRFKKGYHSIVAGYSVFVAFVPVIFLVNPKLTNAGAACMAANIFLATLFLIFWPNRN